MYTLLFILLILISFIVGSQVLANKYINPYTLNSIETVEDYHKIPEY